MSEEQMRILKMIEEKKISAEDGAKLLGALNAANSAREAAAEARTEAQRARSGWRFPDMPAPPSPPSPPAMPPLPPFDPFEEAFSRRGRRDEARERRRGRRDTEPLESETRRSGGPRFFRIRVTDPDNERTMVNVNLPIGLINFGLKLAARYIPEDAGIDLETINQAIQEGAIGRIIDVQEGTEDAPGPRVEIFVE